MGLKLNFSRIYRTEGHYAPYWKHCAPTIYNIVESSSLACPPPLEVVLLYFTCRMTCRISVSNSIYHALTYRNDMLSIFQLNHGVQSLSTLSHKSPKAQRHRSRRRRADPATSNSCSSRRDLCQRSPGSASPPPPRRDCLED